jgi:hypothetical protein
VSIGQRVRKALGDGGAEMRADAPDPRFRGRTYAIPFEDVWQASLALLEKVGCSLRLANDRDGIIIAEASSVFPRRVDDVTVSVVLDKDAQTRVDMRSIARDAKSDLGANARRVTRFFELLDRRLAEQPWRPRSTGAHADG